MTDPTQFKGIHMSLLRSDYGTSELNVFRDVQRVTIVGTVDHRHPADLSKRVVLPLDRMSQVFGPTEQAPAAVLVYRNMGDRQLVHVEPLEAEDQGYGPRMYGGTYAESSDSRISALVGFYGAVAVHDRVESWALYNSMD